MDAKGESFGILNAAYGIGRAALLEWMNELLELQLTKIEQAATGAVYCQIMDAIYPGTFKSFSKVKWQAKFDYEYVENYKVLQDAFKKNNVSKVIDVERLIKCRYQDNLEFCQWMKAYHGNMASGQPYDAAGRRGPANYNMHYILGGNKVHLAPNKPKPAGPSKYDAPSMTGEVDAKYAVAKRPATASQREGGYMAPTFSKASKEPVSGVGAKAVSTTVKTISNKAAMVNKQEVETLKNQVAEMQENNQVLEKEREFYFMKLQYIEQALKLNGLEENAVGSGVLNIMYAGEEDQVTVNETTGDIEVLAEGESEIKIYSLKEDAAVVESIPAREEANPEEDLLEEGSNVEMKD